MSAQIIATPTKRSFGGKTSGFANKEESKFERAHLNAYLKGATHFNFGSIGLRPHIRRRTFQVNEIWS